MKSKNLLFTGIFFSLAPASMQQCQGARSMASESPNETGSSGKRPNILFIVSEDNGQALSCYGSPIKTPNLDRLASEGTRFLNAYVPQAGCSPSRASFLTGLYPHQNGQVGLATWDYSMYQDHTPNLVNDLKGSGYRTGIIGKIHVNPESAFDFDMWEIHGGNFQRKNLDRYAEAASEFIGASDEPFYLQVNYPDAHDPFLPQVDGRPAHVLTGKDVEVLPYFGVSSDKIRQQTADYYNCMVRLDGLVGELLEKLRESGKYENTLIVYIGDHGADLLRGKRTCYEGGTLIPLLIKPAGKGAVNAVSDELVSTIDLYPTFMEATGNPIRDYLPGKSLLPILEGKHEHLRDYLFTEYHVHSNHNPWPQRTVRDRRFKLIWNPLTGLENPGYYYTIGKKIDREDFETALAKVSPMIQQAYDRMRTPPEYELYDLENDPYEWNNLAGDKKYAAEFERLKKVLLNWQKETKDPFIDKEVARRFFQEVMDSHAEKIEIHYHEYMDPGMVFKQ